MAKPIKFKYKVLFEENGGEYTGTMNIECYTIKQVNDMTLEINGAIIKMDEKIYGIRLVG